MAKLRIQAKDEEAALRARSVARQALGRVYFSGDALYLVRGEPDPANLCESLLAEDTERGAAWEPSPVELGFSAGDISRVALADVTEWARALGRWRKFVADYSLPGRQKPQLKRKFDAWKAESLEVEAQQSRLFALVRALPDKPSKGGGVLVLDEADERALEGVPAAPGWAGPPQREWRHYARIAAWSGGLENARRYLDSTRLLVRPEGDRGKREAVLALIKRVSGWISRVERLRRLLTGPLLARGLERVTHRIDADLRRMREKFGVELPPPAGPAGLEDFFPAIEARLNYFLESLPEPPPARVFAAYACLCVGDGGTWTYGAEIMREPGDKDRPWSDSFDLRYFVKAIVGRRGRKGLEGLTGILTCHGWTSDDEIEAIMSMLAAGVRLEDAAWVAQTASSSLPGLAKQGVDPGGLRSLIALLEERGAGLGEGVAPRLLEALAFSGGAPAACAVGRWCRDLAAQGLPVETARAIKGAVLGLADTTLMTPRLRSFLDRWAEPPSRLPSVPGFPESSPELTPVLRRLGYYQRLAQREPSLPLSLAKALGGSNSRERELVYLRAARSEDRLDPGMSQRLALLESRPAGSFESKGASLLPEAREACAAAALEALRGAVAAEVQAAWDQVWGSVAAPVAPEHRPDLCRWRLALPAEGQRLLGSIMTAWLEAGPDYKEKVGANSVWLGRARAHGISVHAWLRPPPSEVRTKRGLITLEAATDPFSILLMGTYFQTCLSLNPRSVDNSLAVLANARDANKAVLLARGPAGEVLARKLVCLNERFEMIGFNTYLAQSQAESEALSEGIGAFCREWSRSAGTPLSDLGLPENIDDSFWYDDGLEPWKPAVFAPSAAAGGNAAALHPDLANALKGRAAACANILLELGIWADLPREDVPAMIADRPGLAEELLGALARRAGDPDLARLVFTRAGTGAGRLEGLTSLGRLLGDPFAEELVANSERWPGMADRAAAMLLDAGSPKTLGLLFRMALDRRISPLWAAMALRRFPAGAAQFYERIAKAQDPARGHDELIFLLELASSSGEYPIPDAVIIRLACVPGGGRPDEWESWNKALAVYLPPLSDPGKHLTAEFLGSMADGKEDNHLDSAAETAAILAMRNPGPESIRFLRERAPRNPCLLLALALAAPRRFETFVRKAAARTPRDPAAMLAVLAACGPAEGLRALNGFLPSDADRGLLEDAAQIFRAYRTLDFRTLAEMPRRPWRGNSNLWPFFAYCAWEWQASNAAFPRLPASEEGSRSLVECPAFLALGLAKKMKTAEGLAARLLPTALRQSLYLLRNACGIEKARAPELMLLLNFLAGARYLSHKARHNTGPMPAMDNGALPYLLLDSDWTLPPPGVSSRIKKAPSRIAFPDDLPLALRYLRFIADKGHWDRYALKEGEPAGEIQKRLIAQALRS